MMFNERLSAFRRSFNMSQETFAEEMQVSISQYQRYEYGKQCPTIDKVIHLLERTGTTFDDLLGGSNHIRKIK